MDFFFSVQYKRLLKRSEGFQYSTLINLSSIYILLQIRKIKRSKRSGVSSNRMTNCCYLRLKPLSVSQGYCNLYSSEVFQKNHNFQ